jgi:carbonic anhydrase/acetyltransferase-like protein (isoleucine patch superfamily)
LIGAGALVTEGKIFPDRSLILGAPAKMARQLSNEDVEKMHRAAPGYVKRQEMYKKQLMKIG